MKISVKKVNTSAADDKSQSNFAQIWPQFDNSSPVLLRLREQIFPSNICPKYVSTKVQLWCYFCDKSAHILWFLRHKYAYIVIFSWQKCACVVIFVRKLWFFDNYWQLLCFGAFCFKLQCSFWCPQLHNRVSHLQFFLISELFQAGMNVCHTQEQ